VTADLERLARDAGRDLEDASPQEVLRWTEQHFGDRWVVASSMQDAVLIDLAVQVRSDVRVLFLDTGYHFAETLGVRDAVAVRYPGLRLVNAVPERTVAEQDEAEGPRLYERDPDRCCHLRKVVPLRRYLDGFGAWVTGLRRVDAPSRAGTPVVTWDERHRLVKVNPIAGWSDGRFEEYVAAHDVLVNLLIGEGYPSIGCAPCTAPVTQGADLRSGRWQGRSKTECGLHP